MKSLFYYCSVEELITLVDQDTLVVSWERSYERHYYNGLTEKEDDWEAGEFRVEFDSSIIKGHRFEKSGNCWYSSEPAHGVVQFIRETVNKSRELKVSIEGRLLLGGWSEVSRLYRLGELLLEEQCVGEDKQTWEAFMTFCEKNDGYVFPKDFKAVFNQNGLDSLG